MVEFNITVASPGEAGPATLNIEAYHTEAPAGGAFMFNAVFSGFDETYGRYPHIVWTTNRTAGTYSLLPPFLDNFWGRADNTMRGLSAIFAYNPTPAEFAAAPNDWIDYDVTATAYDGINDAVSDTITVRVHDPDVYFPGTQTLLVSKAGNFGTDYPSARTYTDEGAAIDDLRDGGGPYRILFARGEEYNTLLSEKSWFFCADYMQVGAFGSGARPRLFGKIELRRDGSCDTTVRDIECYRNYDPVNNPTGTAIDMGSVISVDDQGAGIHTSIVNCKLSNNDYGVKVNGGRKGAFIVDTEITDTRNAQVYGGDAGWSGFVGCAITDDLNVQTGDGSSSKGSNPYPWHFTRFSRIFEPICQSKNYLRSLHSWSMTSSNYGVQPCFRTNPGANSNGTTPPIPQISMCENLAIGGKWGVPATNLFNPSPYPTHTLIDGLIHIPWVDAGYVAEFDYPRIEARNVLEIIPDISWSDAKFITSQVPKNDADQDFMNNELEESLNLGIRIFSSTVVVLKTSAPSMIWLQINETSDLSPYIESPRALRNNVCEPTADAFNSNNLLHHPGDGETLAGLNTTPLGASGITPLGPYYLGQSTWDGQPRSNWAVSDDVIATYRQSSPPAYSIGYVAVCDIAGTIRDGMVGGANPGGTPRQGAWE